MVSNVIGQGKADEVIPLIIKVMKLSSSIAIVGYLLLNIFPVAFLSIYGQEGEFIKLGVQVLRIVSIAMLLMSFSSIWLYAVTGTGNSRYTFLIEFAAILFYCVYIYIVLEVKYMSIVWGWLSEFLYWVILFSLSFLYIKSKKWIHTKI
jgi:MATE family multidrug resistance protein